MRNMLNPMLSKDGIQIVALFPFLSTFFHFFRGMPGIAN